MFQFYINVVYNIDISVNIKMKHIRYQHQNANTHIIPTKKSQANSTR